jgi:hypothetical protein
MLPWLALALALARTRLELRRKICLLIGVLVIAMALRWPWYLLGLFSDSAPFVFPDDFTVVYSDALSVSVLFQHSFGWAGPLLVVSSLAGAVLTLRRDTGDARAAAWVLIGIVVSLVVLRLILPNVRWIYPPPAYVEVTIWPFYAAFAAIDLVRMYRMAGARYFRAMRLPSLRVRPEWLLPLPAAVTTFAVVLLHHPMTQAFPFPPRSAELVDILRHNIALGFEAAFRGRVATILPVDPQGSDPWLQQLSESARFAKETGDDDVSVGLWFFQIPTLFEYNQFTSPGFHALIKRTLQKPSLRHQRNITVFTSPDARILRLLGVRYVLAPPSEAVLGEVRWTQTIAGDALRLIELAAPNLASDTPTALVVRHDLRSALEVVADNDIDLAHTAVTYGDVEGELVPADATSLSVRNGDLHLTAASPGRSLIVVPIEYSHCLELRPGPAVASTTDVSFHRVQGILTGVLFERKLDIVLAFRTGPFRNPLCRLRDYQDFKALSPW